MSTDLKTSFYFRHRELIEEWAALRKPAQNSFDTALRGLSGRLALAAEGADVMPVETQGQWSKIRVLKPTWIQPDWRLSIALAWNTADLLKLDGVRRPYVGVTLDDSSGNQRQRSKGVHSQCSEIARDLGWKEPRQDAWPVWGWIDQPTDDFSLDSWVEACVASFALGWSALHELLEEIATD